MRYLAATTAASKQHPKREPESSADPPFETVLELAHVSESVFSKSSIVTRCADYTIRECKTWQAEFRVPEQMSTILL
jgi:hypothetical protein